MKKKEILSLVLAIAMLSMCMSGLTVFAEDEASDAEAVTFETVWEYTDRTVWNYTENDLSFGTGEYLYKKALDDDHGDVLVMASAADAATTVAEPSGIEFPTADISYISMDLQPKSTEYPVGIDFFGANGNPCGLSFNIFGVLLVGQGWVSSPIASSETEIDTYLSSLKYGKFNANEWVNIKVVNNQKDNELSFYVNDVLFKTESTALNHFSSMRIVQYNDKKNVAAGTEMLYVDNVEVGTLQAPKNSSVKTVWDYTENDLSFGTGDYFYEKTLEDGHGDVLVMASASDTAVTIAEPSGIEFPTDDISYISMDLQPKSTDYPVGIDFFGANGNPCGLSFNLFGVLLVGQGWMSSFLTASEAEIDQYLPSLKYGKFNANEWVNIKVVNNQKDKELSFYVNDVLFKTEATALDHFGSMRIVQYNDKKNVAAGTEMLYIDNVEIGTAQITEMSSVKIVNATGAEIDEFNKNESVYVNADITNNTSAAQDYIVILAVYDKYNACVAANLHELKGVQSGQSGYVDGETFGLTLPDEAVTVKAFCWNTWDSLAPVCGFDTATLKSAE